MSWFVSDEPVAVDVGACRCPGGPHETDTIWLLPTLSTPGGFAANLVISQSSSNPEQLEVELGRVYLEFGITRWSLVDEDGNAVAVERDLIRRLPWAITEPVASKASELYSEDLLRPLVARASASSSNGHTAGNGRSRAKSTSVKPRSSSARRKR